MVILRVVMHDCVEIAIHGCFWYYAWLPYLKTNSVWVLEEKSSEWLKEH